MNILFVSREYLPETGWGGIATYTKILAEALIKRGHDVTVLAYSPSQGCSVLVNGVKVVRTHVSYFYRLYPLAILKRIRSIVEKEKIDIIESPEHAAEVVIYQKIRTVPVVVRLHFPTFLGFQFVSPTPFQIIVDKAERAQTQNADSVTSASENLAKVVCENWKLDRNRIRVIPNGLDIDYLTSVRSRGRTRIVDGDYIMFYGRLESKKGVPLLVDSLPFVFEKIPDLKVVFVGKDTWYENSLMSKYILGRLSRYRRNVIIMKHIPRDKLISLIGNSNLLVFPSLIETFGYSVLESMALGKCVIASRNGSFRELVEDGKSGFLASVNPKELAEKIVFCLNEVDLQKIGNNAAEKARRFDISLIAEETIENYAKTIAEFQKN